MSGGTRLENANPLIFQRSGERLLTASEEDEDVSDPIDDREIFDILKKVDITTLKNTFSVYLCIVGVINMPLIVLVDNQCIICLTVLFVCF